MTREEIRGLVKYMLFTMHFQRHNQIKGNFVALKLHYLRSEKAKMLSNFTILEIINYFIQIASSDDGARRDFKSLRISSCQLFKAGHIQDPKAKVGCHHITIIFIDEFDLCFGRQYSFSPATCPPI